MINEKLINNNFRWANCPLCSSKEIKNIGNIEYRKPILFSSHILDLINIPILALCESCNSWFTQNIIPEAEAMSLYMLGDSSSKWPRMESFEKTKHKVIVDHLDLYFNAGKKVLDIGSNTGDLLDYAKSNGAETYAVEPSAASQKLLSKKNHFVFSSFNEVKEKFDVVTAFDLIEHLHDVNSFLLSIYDILNENGILVILTGNNKSLSAKLSKNRWWYLKEPAHIVFPSLSFYKSITFFDVASIKKTYASIGYERPLYVSILKFLGKTLLKDGYDGLSSLGPDHILITLKKNSKKIRDNKV